LRNLISQILKEEYGEKSLEEYLRDIVEEEIIGEEEMELASGSGGGSGSVWDSGAQRGPANPIGNSTWVNNLSRGPANPVGATKWTGAQHGKANPL
jgi:hypothetical protein